MFAGLAGEHDLADAINLCTGQYLEVEHQDTIHRFILSEAPSMHIIALPALAIISMLQVTSIV